MEKYFCIAKMFNKIVPFLPKETKDFHEVNDEIIDNSKILWSDDPSELYLMYLDCKKDENIIGIKSNVVVLNEGTFDESEMIALKWMHESNIIFKKIIKKITSEVKYYFIPGDGYELMDNEVVVNDINSEEVGKKYLNKLLTRRLLRVEEDAIILE